MELEAIVILTLHSPKEQIWGQLMALTPAGLTVRGIAVNAFDEILRQISVGEAGVGALSTIFYPIHRVERMTLDETIDEIPSLAERFEHKVGLSLVEFLGAGRKL